jgi:hypothetical protein
MDSLQYQKSLAEFDEQIAYHDSKKKQIAHEKSRFILAVLSATVESEEEKKSLLKN